MEADQTQPVESLPVRESLRRRAARRLLRAETLYAVMLLAFAVLAGFAYFDKYFGWDLRISRGLQNLSVPGLLDFMRAVSFFGNTWKPFAITTLTTLVFLAFSRRSEAAGLVLSTGGSALLNSLIKITIARPRPTSDLVMVYRDLTTQSFPSGHVTFYVCYFGFLFFVAYALLPLRSLARRVALTLILLPIVLVGFSRVYLGAHWPSDTLGAYLMSGLWLAFSLHLYRIWKERATFHPEEAPVDKEASASD
jgi:membrane-associated phospholipid phosphatase